jgi:hypothetical protein
VDVINFDEELDYGAYTPKHMFGQTIEFSDIFVAFDEELDYGAYTPKHMFGQTIEFSDIFVVFL